MPAASRIGDRSRVPADVHGCPACPHPAVGAASVGSSNVLINTMPAVRQGDGGPHAACCGVNRWSAVAGSSTVFINGQPAVRRGDLTLHCGGLGQMIEGSPDVNLGG